MAIMDKGIRVTVPTSSYVSGESQHRVTAGFTITGKINRLDFGVGGSPISTGVGNQIELRSNVEFTIPELHEQLLLCLDTLSKLGSFECNYAIGENTVFSHKTWITKQELIEEIKLFQEKKISWGDIYIRFN